jgi:hypothetical protein
MQQCRKTLDPISKTFWSSCMGQNMSDVYQVDIKPFKKDKFFCKYLLWIDFY